MREMWPSQILLGENDIFDGKSGVVQMPTSSGKTTSVALAIQSSFLSDRTNIAIIVAPFRALCREILLDLENFFSFDESVAVTEFSDIPKNNEISILSTDSSEKKILVMTPEKLSYILKHNKEIIDYINMIVFDEAHLFDDESRGTDYELLLSTIKYYIKDDAQKLLVSAVISNASQLNEWINEQGVVVKNNTIKTTEKTVAFNTFNSTKRNSYSNLYFVDPIKGLEEEFFVPRVIQPVKLNKLGKERNIRYFPDLEKNKQDVSIYYAIKLVKNGSVAIFCSRKDTVNKVLSRFIELEERGVPLTNFIEESDIHETTKIARLIKEHLGENPLYFSALKGIVGHHSGVPNGVRVSTEYALRNSLLSCVVCTSTLAQGVNLPLKYLIISNVYQSREIIKVRDFHNLLGRTARAGKQTEGTIILTENVYKTNQDSYKLDKYEHLLNADNSEACYSNLLKIVRGIELSDKSPIPSSFIKKYISSRYLNSEKYFENRKK
ncbi:DEAD/DEAH box helicase [Atopobacter phocae]|uniref:DEAD/DEAH box helicase n=1 Tax=Atopobacter phocae TaxID=136492 RepID=UPI001FE05EEC|nr:DEAD/DEAH box helicase [Atopobacter phocae]